MIISYIDCYRNKVIRAELDNKINNNDVKWTCSYYEDKINKLIDKFVFVYNKEYVANIQDNFNEIFFKKHTEYKRK